MRLPLACLLAALAACSTHDSNTTPRPPSPTAAPASHDDRMAWWREARFGMFVHWGLYAIPQGAYGGKTDYGEWIRDSAQIPIDTYDRFQSQWNPTAFDADAWARAAKEAGMKYLVLTSKHHDGFCLFDSAETEWDVMNTAHGRDICAELADACERHGVVFCTYHSIMDWHHDDYLPRRPWEAKDRSAAGADFDRYERYLHAQVREVITKYRPAVMWFDGEWEATWNHERGVRLFELCRELAPSMLVNNRVDVHRSGMQGFSQSGESKGDFATPEQEIPPTGVEGVDWESCMTMNRHWGFNAADTEWKSTATLVKNLVDIASKGGNYLLNVGPRADGSFPPEAIERLQQIAAWMATNGASIHGTTANVFDATPWGRCTVRVAEDTSTIYLHLFDAEKGHHALMLKGLTNPITSVRVLGDRGVQSPAGLMSPFSPTAPFVEVTLTDPDPIATVVEVVVQGRLDVVRAPRIEAEPQQFVHALTASITAEGKTAVTTWTIDGTEPTEGSTRAAGPVRIDASCTLRAASFVGGERATEIVEQQFTKVEPLPPVEPVANNQGLRFAKLSMVEWTKIPDDRNALVVDTWGTTAAVALPKNPGEHVALRYQGFLDVGDDELYRFALSSDDGSKLWIGGQLVVDNDGLHGSIEKRGAIALGAGLHAIEVVWFNATGGAELELRWAAPGQAFVEVPKAALRH